MFGYRGAVGREADPNPSINLTTSPVASAGIIADRVFGYRGAVGREADPALQLMNATALGNSLLAVLGVPWLLCFIAYFCAQPD